MAPQEVTPKLVADLIRRADTGDHDAFRRLTEIDVSKVLPDSSAVGLTMVLEELLVQTAGEKALYTQEVLRSELRSLKLALEGSNPTPLEKMLAEQVAIDWMVLRLAEISLKGFKSGFGQEFESLQRRVQRSHGRLHASIRTLAQVRRLQVPSLVQVNIAEKQVNVGR